MRILLIEDDPLVIGMVAAALANDGHTVVGERIGTIGRHRAIDEQWDLIISDIGLPDTDGFAIARQLRQAGVDAPLIALTGYTSDADRAQALASGFDDFLTKPILASALREEIRFQLSRPRSPRPAARPLAPIAATPAVSPAAPVALAAAAPRRRGVLGGLVVIALGVPFLMQPLGIPNAASYLFITMGAAFLISYLRGRQYVYLIPMVTLTSFGVALLLPTWITMRPESAAPAFVGIIAIGFIVAFALAPQHRWPLVPAFLLGVVAASRFATGASVIPLSLEPFLVPLALIAVGTYLLAEPKT